MTEPKDGDFAAFLQKNQSKTGESTPTYLTGDTNVQSANPADGVLSITAETLIG